MVTVKRDVNVSIPNGRVNAPGQIENVTRTALGGGHRYSWSAPQNFGCGLLDSFAVYKNPGCSGGLIGGSYRVSADEAGVQAGTYTIEARDGVVGVAGHAMPNAGYDLPALGRRCQVVAGSRRIADLLAIVQAAAAAQVTAP